ncbi:MAG: hemerythrin family protein [Proteobacteria bacterium]|nr:hemerythrin family protein [Pseudomonadota bacterium]
MGSFNWRKEFSIGVDEMDKQHMELVRIINDIHQAINEGRGKERLGGMLDRLLKYTDYHFAAEEKLMKKHRYPPYEEHKGKHAAMRKKVLSLIRESSGGREAMIYSVLDFLQGWLTKHIMETDRKYANYLNDN